MKTKLLLILTVVISAAASSPAWGCAALIGTRGAVQLGKTTTLAAYVDGKEHYITSFEFSGGGGEFGSIVPLPGIPEKVEKGGEWTLKRLLREVQPETSGRVAAAAEPRAASAEVIQEVRIDALDITILKGGGAAVGEWAKEHGFLLPPDAPKILDYYADRSPIFMAAIFDAKAADERGQEVGDGTPIHLTIPTDNPWVPLRILGLGKARDTIVEAEVFLLTQRKPALLPVRAEGLELRRRELASVSLLADLRSDQGMGWLPAEDMWLTYMSINGSAADLRFDLAADVSGKGRPSYHMAGLQKPLPKPVLPKVVEPSAPLSSPSAAALPISPTPGPSVIAVRPTAKVSTFGAVGLITIALAVGLLTLATARRRLG